MLGYCMILMDILGCWGVYITVCKIIPSGLKASPYIYKTIGMIVTSYFGVCHYSDDRLASKQL